MPALIVDPPFNYPTTTTGRGRRQRRCQAVSDYSSPQRIIFLWELPFQGVTKEHFFCKLFQIHQSLGAEIIVTDSTWMSEIINVIIGQMVKCHRSTWRRYGGLGRYQRPTPPPAQITAAVNLVANWCREDSSTKPTLINPNRALKSANLPQLWNGSRNVKDSNGLILKMVVDLATSQPSNGRLPQQLLWCLARRCLDWDQPLLSDCAAMSAPGEHVEVPR